MLISKETISRMVALTTLESPAPKNLGSATVAARFRAPALKVQGLLCLRPNLSLWHLKSSSHEFTSESRVPIL